MKMTIAEFLKDIEKLNPEYELVFYSNEEKEIVKLEYTGAVRFGSVVQIFLRPPAPGSAGEPKP